MRIWIVEGITGAYSDRTDWVVCAYKSQDLAEEHTSKAMHRAKEIENTRESRYDVPYGVNEYDLNMRMDYTGTEYYTFECELKD